MKGREMIRIRIQKKWFEGNRGAFVGFALALVYVAVISGSVVLLVSACGEPEFATEKPAPLSDYDRHLAIYRSTSQGEGVLAETAIKHMADFAQTEEEMIYVTEHADKHGLDSIVEQMNERRHLSVTNNEQRLNLLHYMYNNRYYSRYPEIYCRVLKAGLREVEKVEDFNNYHAMVTGNTLVICPGIRELLSKAEARALKHKDDAKRERLASFIKNPSYNELVGLWGLYEDGDAARDQMIQAIDGIPLEFCQLRFVYWQLPKGGSRRADYLNKMIIKAREGNNFGNWNSMYWLCEHAKSSTPNGCKEEAYDQMLALAEQVK